MRIGIFFQWLSQTISLVCFSANSVSLKMEADWSLETSEQTNKTGDHIKIPQKRLHSRKLLISTI